MLSSVQAIVQAEQALGYAIAARRGETLLRLTHPRFSYIGSHPAGLVVQTQAAWVCALAKMQTYVFVQAVRSIDLFAQAALVTVDGSWVGKTPGAADQQQLTMSDTWLLEDGDWTLARRHASTVEPFAAGAPVEPSRVIPA